MTDTPASSPLSRKIIRNTIFNFAGRSWTMIVGLLLTPYIVSVLGVQQFGIWSLVFVITRYFGLLDLGVGTSFVKYIAEYYARKDYEAINEVVNTGFVFYLAVAVVLIALAVLADDFVLRLFRIPSPLFADARFVLLGAVAIFALSNAFGTFKAVLQGLQRMDVTNAIVVMVSIPSIVGTIVFLQLGYGLRGLIANEAMVFVLTATAFAACAFRLLPGLRISPSSFSRRNLKTLMRYGAMVQISRLADLGSSQADKILLGLFLGLGPVTFYELGARIVLAGKRLSQILASAVLPAASELEAIKDRQTLYQLYTRGTKYLALTTLPLLFLLVTTAQLIMRSWVGEGYETAALAIQLLATGHLVHALTGVGTMTVKGIGKPEYETRYTLLLLIMNTTLGLVAVVTLGYPGVLVATAFSLTASSLYFFFVFHRLLRTSLVDFLRETCSKPLIACALAVVPVVVLNRFAVQTGGTLGRVTSLALLGLDGFVFVCAYGAAILKMGHLDSYDRRVLTRIGQAIVRA